MTRRKFFISLAILSLFTKFYSDQDYINIKIVDGWFLNSHDLNKI